MFLNKSLLKNRIFAFIIKFLLFFFIYFELVAKNRFFIFNEIKISIQNLIFLAIRNIIICVYINS